MVNTLKGIKSFVLSFGPAMLPYVEQIVAADAQLPEPAKLVAHIGIEEHRAGLAPKYLRLAVIGSQLGIAATYFSSWFSSKSEHRTNPPAVALNVATVVGTHMASNDPSIGSSKFCAAPVNVIQH